VAGGRTRGAMGPSQQDKLWYTTKIPYDTGARMLHIGPIRDLPSGPSGLNQESPAFEQTGGSSVSSAEAASSELGSEKNVPQFGRATIPGVERRLPKHRLLIRCVGSMPSAVVPHTT